MYAALAESQTLTLMFDRQVNRPALFPYYHPRSSCLEKSIDTKVSSNVLTYPTSIRRLTRTLLRRRGQ